MKIKTAIKYFADEVQFYERAYDRNKGQAWMGGRIAACKLAVEALENMAGTNEPLALEELQRMIGEPVWVVDKHWGSERWEIVGESLLGLYRGFDAYRHRPEEGPSNGNKETM